MIEEESLTIIISGEGLTIAQINAVAHGAKGEGALADVSRRRTVIGATSTVRAAIGELAR
jgi:hypothetical protein